MALHAEVTSEDDPKRLKGPKEEGVLVHGLSLEGCQWDRNKKLLAEANPKELFSPLPVLHMTAYTNEKKAEILGKKLFYTCPIYMLPKRTGQFYINRVSLPSDRDPQHWVIRGVALLVDIS